MSERNSKIPENQEIVSKILESILTDTFQQITDKFYKLKSVHLYHDSFMLALQDILDIYDKPKPCIDHSHIIEAWQRDKPAQPSAPDSLMREFLKEAM